MLIKYKILIVIIAIILAYIQGIALSAKTGIQVIQVYHNTTDPVQEYAHKRVSERFGIDQSKYFIWIVESEGGEKEGRWNNEAQNPESTAYGLMQFLDSTWSIVGCEKTNDPYVQIDCGIEYVAKIYGTPEKAWGFHLINNYY